MAASARHADDTSADERSPGPSAATLLRRRIKGVLRAPAAPLVLLAVVSVLSLGVRAAWLGLPCNKPCRTPADHRLIFDETYYANAARVIAGVHLAPGTRYAGAPAGEDPNAEHPQLVKLIIAGSIEAFGDGPLAWRLGSLIFGSLAILGMFALVRAAGGGRWLALGAASLMAADNLLLVHGRIATLDVYVVALMIWGAALYLRGRPVVAGAVIGIGACAKLVAPYVLLVLALVEVFRVIAARRTARADRAELWAGARRRLRDLAVCALSAAGVFVALLAVLDRVAPPYDPVTATTIRGGPFAHIAHMLQYAASQTSPNGSVDPASYPWQWLGDYRPIIYSDIGLVHHANRQLILHPVAHFLGFISPPILLFALPALAVAAWSAGHGARDVDLVGIAWFLGTFCPFLLLSLLASRTSYIYYMVVVMPSVYMLVARLFARGSVPAWAVGCWVACVVLAAVVLYPFTPIPGL
jgi:dolichyl-phosphate-mannose-protein mannosyltransferase